MPVADDVAAPTSFYWYDLETTGTHPPSDRIMQFAGQRTDAELRPLGPPLQTYVRLGADVLPTPDACLVTGITPRVAAEGKDEWRALGDIERELLRPDTCVVGYNNLRFDDEFLRHGFYRNLMDPYAWAWRDGNSRWDLLDFARAAQALRPQGVRWPRRDGALSFRLADLAADNGIGHLQPHEALGDVTATIAFARLLKDAQPRLWRYALAHRARDQAQRLLTSLGGKVCVHVSASYTTERHCAAPVVALARHPDIATRMIVADLSRDIAELIEADATALRERLFAPASERSGERPPLKTVTLNRCPFLAPIATVRAEDAARLEWDLSVVERRRRDLAAEPDLSAKIAEAYRLDGTREAPRDAELALYDGFFEDADRLQAEKVRQALAENAAWPPFAPRDERLRVLGARLKALARGGELDADERESWRRHVRSCLRDGFGNRPSLPAYRARLEALRQGESDGGRQQVLADLAAFAAQVERDQ